MLNRYTAINANVDEERTSLLRIAPSSSRRDPVSVLVSSTENCGGSTDDSFSSQHSQATTKKQSATLESGRIVFSFWSSDIISHIAQTEKEAKDRIILQYANELRVIICNDEFFDGEISKSEHYIVEAYNKGQLDYLSEALMKVYSESFDDSHILEGILTMISSVPYDAIAPKGQIMALGLLTNKELCVRDKAIQCFERWNSKKGLDYLRNIHCSPSWLQKYVEKVIVYLERDGVE